MKALMKNLSLGTILGVAVIVGSALANPAQASLIIDFEAFPSGAPFVGGVEDGFNVKPVGTGEFITPPGFGNLPGVLAASAYQAGDRPIYELDLVSSASFYFKSLDILDVFNTGSQPNVVVKGFLGVGLVGTDSFAPPAIYQTFGAVNLAGKLIDRLVIDLGLQNQGGPTAIDNIDLQPVPEPSTIILLGSGLAGIMAWRYRKNNAKA